MLRTIRALRLVDQALLAAGLTSAALLAGAHLFESFGRLAPCDLCLDQREAHWTALALAAGGALAGLAFKWRRAAAATAGACALVYLVSAGLALYHVGVEYHYWPGPTACAGGGAVDLGARSLSDILNEKPGRPSCAEAAWRFLGVSMAGYNLLVSAALFALCLIAALDAARQARRGAHGEPAARAAS
jgi:disulfide bond formation protein DsbB